MRNVKYGLNSKQIHSIRYSYTKKLHTLIKTITIYKTTEKYKNKNI